MPQVEVNAPKLDVMPKDEVPMMLTVDIGVTATHPTTGEKLEVVRSLTNPFFFVLRGEKGVGVIDVQPMIQECLLHVEARNF